VASFASGDLNLEMDDSSGIDDWKLMIESLLVRLDAASAVSIIDSQSPDSR
jgi:hypothetical protein